MSRLPRIAPALLLFGIAAVSWAVTAVRMRGMDMGPGTNLGSLGWFAVVWATMMAAMMLPSLVPIARASPEARASSSTTSNVVFGGGYLLTWVGAGALAYAVIRAVGALDLSWLTWDGEGQYVAGGVILGAALYELTPIKSAFLRKCRDRKLLARRRRHGLLLTGLEHGGFCVGSSGALMAALFAVGVMSLTWMIVVAALVAIEKLLPWEGVAIGATSVFVATLGLGVALAPDRVPGLTIPM